jgi:hypothetical protein
MRYYKKPGVGQILASIVVLSAIQPIHAGMIIGELSTSYQTNANLTTLGTQDWAVWGFANNGTSTSLTPDVTMNGGAGIGSLTNITNGNPLRGVGQFGRLGGQSSFTWSNGTPTASTSNTSPGIQHDGAGTGISTIGEGFSLTVAASTTPQTLTLYTATNYTDSKLVASLSDGSATPYTSNVVDLGVLDGSAIYTITFAANSPGQTLTISDITQTQDDSIDNTGNVIIQAAALSVASVPEPSSFSLVALVIAALTVCLNLKSAVRRLA